MTETDLAWAGGLFEGEGCITVQRTKQWYYVKLILKMTDKDVVEKFHAIANAGTLNRLLTPSMQAKGYQPQWHWQCSGRKAEDFLWKLLPYLGERRRARAAEVITTVRNCGVEL